jgi:hypothetical protein
MQLVLTYAEPAGDQVTLTCRLTRALQVEAMAQLGGLILLPPGEEGSEGGTDKIFFFGGVDSCRFRKTVLPGDKLVRAPRLSQLVLPPAVWSRRWVRFDDNPSW